jgi:putative phage-type endonuclease
MSFYLVDDIEQGTAKWLQWRRGVIGASEAAIIMGENRWKGRQQLIDEKRGLIEPFKGNDVTREGNLNEPFARAALERKYKEKLSPTIVQDIHEPFLAASLDAINSSKNQIYEIKCGARTYETVEISRKVPSYYVAQVQHMLMVTQMESLIFAAYRPQEPLITFEVFRNDSYIRELRRKEKDFIKELEGHGHKIQYEFRGYQVGKASNKPEAPKKRASKKTLKPAWKIEAGLLRFWDGSDYLEGEEPGLYELFGENHYWDGEEWCLPDEIGSYNLNGDEHFWNGDSWE